MVIHQKIYTVAKAVQINAIEEVKKKGSWRCLRKQDTMIADATGAVRLVLWEDIDKIKEGASFRINGANVRTFDHQTILPFLANAP